MLRALEAQAPPKQNATDTINTLSGRLADATLLEDRRAAILGLRSFAKQYPATVASGSLRTLLDTLARDVEDIDTGKVILETLLNLFHPEETSPEASDDITRWLADEFTMRNDRITLLLDLLNLADFYSRLYALELLTAIGGIDEERLQRLQDCILAAPLGTSKLVDLINARVEQREPIQTATLTLLNDLTVASVELQKSVAFNGAFEHIFNLIRANGSLVFGGIIVQDCLSLLHNLISFNVSNQDLFRESGFVHQLFALLGSVYDERQDDEVEPENAKDKNLWGLLQVIRLFIDPESRIRISNQRAFAGKDLQHLDLVLKVGLDQSIGLPIRAEAFRTCADMIRRAPEIQARVGVMQIWVAAQDAGGEPGAQPMAKDYVLDALLDVTFHPQQSSSFDLRYSACQCIEAWVDGNSGAKMKAMDFAIQDYFDKDKDYGFSVPLKVLMAGPSQINPGDPHQLWFAAYLAFRLIHDEPDVQAALLRLAEGDASKGEEVVTCAQMFVGHVIAALQSNQDQRTCVSYLMVLCSWCFENSEAVNDFLSEGSVVRSLIDYTTQPRPGMELLQGLCTFLLGIVYEFSTGDSPIPRKDLQKELRERLTRETYILRLRDLRRHETLRVEPGTISEQDALFNDAFLDFLFSNFRTIKLAIDKDSSIEALRPSEGIDRDYVEKLKSQISEKDEKYQSERQEWQSTSSQSKSWIEQLQAELQSKDAQLRAGEGTLQKEIRTREEKMQNERSTMKKINDSLHADIDKLKTSHVKDIEKVKAGHGRDIDNLKTSHEKQVRDLKSSHASGTEQVLARERQKHDEVSKAHREVEKSRSQLQEKLETLESENKALNDTIADLRSQLSSLKREQEILQESARLSETNVRKLEDQIEDNESRLQLSREHEAGLEKEVKSRDEAMAALKAELETKEDARASAQTELDDLLIVLGDLEDKRTRDKTQIKELGGEISDDDEEDEDNEDEGDEEPQEDEEDDQAKQDGRPNGHQDDGEKPQSNGNAGPNGSDEKDNEDVEDETHEDKTEKHDEKSDVQSVASSKAQSKSKKKKKKGKK